MLRTEQGSAPRFLCLLLPLPVHGMSQFVSMGYVGNNIWENHLKTVEMGKLALQMLAKELYV